MKKQEALAFLAEIRSGKLSDAEAISKLESSSFAELNYAKVDLHRESRQGFPEVILGSGKTPEQIIGIAKSLRNAGQSVLVTRISPAAAQAFVKTFPNAKHCNHSRCLTLRDKAIAPRAGLIAIASGGTGDLPVAEEAALVAEFMGNQVDRIYDIGVAGLSRLLHRLETFSKANVIIAVAGMEAALPSVLAGLVDKPILAVPTSIGYGAHFGGLAALLGMLNSCASGVAVMNIDNGFGAAFAANRINRLANSKC